MNFNCILLNYWFRHFAYASRYQRSHLTDGFQKYVKFGGVDLRLLLTAAFPTETYSAHFA